MKSIFESNGILYRDTCLSLQLSHPCSHCRCCSNLLPGHYVCDNGCWINQHYWHLKAHRLCWKETKDRFEFLLIGEGINATIPERLLYLRIAVEECFPEYLVLLNELADKHRIERLGH